MNDKQDSRRALALRGHVVVEGDKEGLNIKQCTKTKISQVHNLQFREYKFI